MTDKLPPNLLALFAPRPPLRWVPPSDVPAEERKTAAISGVADFLPALAEYEREYDYKPTESWLERRERLKLEHAAKVQEIITEGPRHCTQLIQASVSYFSRILLTPHLCIDNPNEDVNIRGDAFKTLIVARLSYEADEKDLEREFGRFGPIERVSFPLASPTPQPVRIRLKLTLVQIRIVTDTHADEKGNKKRKPHRGYAFVVFEREKDMRGNKPPLTPH